MTYVLLVVKEDQQPDFIQGSIKEINEVLRNGAINDSIDHHQNWLLLKVEDGFLTPVHDYEYRNVLQFSVV